MLSEHNLNVNSIGGNAYLHWRLSRFFEEEGNEERKLTHLGHAVSAVNVALSLLAPSTRKGEGIAFYIGNAGINTVCVLQSL